MAESEKLFIELVRLVSLYTEGELDYENGLRLEELLHDPDVRSLYFEIMDVNIGLEYLGDSFEIINQDIRNNLDPSVLNALAEYENIAPLFPSKHYDFRFEDPILPPKPKIYNKTKIAVRALFSIAAIFMVAVILNFGISKDRPQFASISDKYKAKLVENTSVMDVGSGVSGEKDSYTLLEGMVELHFDNGVKVVLEAPTEYQIYSSDRIGIEYGKLYATVPQEAIGFSVYTPNAIIIDMGTEFGVKTDKWGDTYLQVVKGRTTLIAGRDSGRASIDVLKGQAKKIAANTSVVTDAVFDDNLFVRTFDSREDFVWRGKKNIDLADIVGGGNGFGNGKKNSGLDPETGLVVNMTFGDRCHETNHYNFVSQNPLIDGVFVPNGKTEQIVSSYGHVFKECPVSSGMTYSGIINSPQYSELDRLLLYEYIDYNSESYVFMHANLGVTYDLNAIRSLLPDTKIVKFKSRFGLIAKPPRLLNVDFWVLVDGELKFKKTQFNEQKVEDCFEIDISGDERFLTLVVTDGVDPEGRKFNGMTLSPIDMDYAVFENPILVLE